MIYNVVTGRAGQTPFDLVLQYYGSIDGLAMFLSDNPLAKDHDDSEGITYKIRKGVTINQTVVNHYLNRNHTPVTY